MIFIRYWQCAGGRQDEPVSEQWLPVQPSRDGPADPEYDERAAQQRLQSVCGSHGQGKSYYNHRCFSLIFFMLLVVTHITRDI